MTEAISIWSQIVTFSVNSFYKILQSFDAWGLYVFSAIAFAAFASFVLPALRTENSGLASEVITYRDAQQRNAAYAERTAQIAAFRAEIAARRKETRNRYRRHW